MNQRNLNLLPEEEIFFQTRKHFIIFFPSVLLSVICLFFLFNSNPYVVKFSFLPIIAALISWMNDLLIYLTSYFTVTNKRVILQEGFFFKHINEMRLGMIANITINQSLLGQFLNYGTILLYPFGGQADPFAQIAQPQAFLKMVQLQQDNIEEGITTRKDVRPNRQ